ncbi:hypothetical protein AZI86_12185 [Bdellovibrio bacteriovorus]|uniref:Shikimate dehydrogenase n=1 Tax=Bdellovibrio bacteriovorus TaxID=959 RepID=A0A150WLU8_BDEBC|nr:hypothetical protein [Bdellovibrio bacteriovorus]KYG64950.1 hypothetical protein AZI86_12185 [Bdellovibrio bacteriovorus]
MSTHKILDFGTGTHWAFRFLQSLAQKKGLDWVFEHHDEFSMQALGGATAAFVDPLKSPTILPLFHVVPTQVRAVEILDSLFSDHGGWYPRLLIHEVLRRVFVAEARDLDIRAPAFVIGDGPLCRVAAAVIAEMGVSEIFLVGERADLEIQKKILSRSQLGIAFHVLAVEELTMQATSAGIVVNTADLSSQKALLTDLSYFNFMKQSGFALDLSSVMESNTLLDEARRADLRVLPYTLVMKSLMRLWLERLGADDLITDEEIVQLWSDFLKENPSSV